MMWKFHSKKWTLEAPLTSDDPKETSALLKVEKEKEKKQAC